MSKDPLATAAPTAAFTVTITFVPAALGTKLFCENEHESPADAKFAQDNATGAVQLFCPVSVMLYCPDAACWIVCDVVLEVTVKSLTRMVSARLCCLAPPTSAPWRENNVSAGGVVPPIVVTDTVAFLLPLERSTCGGFTAQTAPAGIVPAQLRSTSELKLPFFTTVTLKLAVCPGVTDWVAALVCSAKSGKTLSTSSGPGVASCAAPAPAPWMVKL